MLTLCGPDSTAPAPWSGGSCSRVCPQPGCRQLLQLVAVFMKTCSPPVDFRRPSLASRDGDANEASLASRSGEGRKTPVCLLLPALRSGIHSTPAWPPCGGRAGSATHGVWPSRAQRSLACSEPRSPSVHRRETCISALVPRIRSEIHSTKSAKTV